VDEGIGRKRDASICTQLGVYAPFAPAASWTALRPRLAAQYRLVPACRKRRGVVARKRRLEPPVDLRAFAELVQDAHSYDWIIFTSPNGVTAFFEMFYKLYDDAREIGSAKIAAIGPGTAQRVKDHHLKVDLQPDEFVAEAVARGEEAGEMWDHTAWALRQPNLFELKRDRGGVKWEPVAAE